MDVLSLAFSFVNHASISRDNLDDNWMTLFVIYPIISFHLAFFTKVKYIIYYRMHFLI